MTLVHDFVATGLAVEQRDELPEALLAMGAALHEQGKNCFGLADGAGLCRDCGTPMLHRPRPWGCDFLFSRIAVPVVSWYRFARWHLQWFTRRRQA